MDVSATLRRLNQAGSLPAGGVDVTLVPVPYAKRDPAGLRLTIERLTLSVAQVK